MQERDQHGADDSGGTHACKAGANARTQACQYADNDFQQGRSSPSDTETLLRQFSSLRVMLRKAAYSSCVMSAVSRFTIRDIADDEEFEKAKAMLRLMCELNTGIRSGEEEGWVSEDDVRAHFHSKRK